MKKIKLILLSCALGFSQILAMEKYAEDGVDFSQKHNEIMEQAQNATKKFGEACQAKNEEEIEKYRKIIWKCVDDLEKLDESGKKELSKEEYNEIFLKPLKEAEEREKKIIESFYNNLHQEK